MLKKVISTMIVLVVTVCCLGAMAESSQPTSFETLYAFLVDDELLGAPDQFGTLDEKDTEDMCGAVINFYPSDYSIMLTGPASNGNTYLSAWKDASEKACMYVSYMIAANWDEVITPTGETFYLCLRFSDNAADVVTIDNSSTAASLAQFFQNALENAAESVKDGETI